MIQSTTLSMAMAAPIQSNPSIPQKPLPLSPPHTPVSVVWDGMEWHHQSVDRCGVVGWWEWDASPHTHDEMDIAIPRGGGRHPPAQHPPIPSTKPAANQHTRLSMQSGHTCGNSIGPPSSAGPQKPKGGARPWASACDGSKQAAQQRGPPALGWMGSAVPHEVRPEPTRRRWVPTYCGVIRVVVGSISTFGRPSGRSAPPRLVCARGRRYPITRTRTHARTPPNDRSVARPPGRLLLPRGWPRPDPFDSHFQTLQTIRPNLRQTIAIDRVRPPPPSTRGEAACGPATPNTTSLLVASGATRPEASPASAHSSLALSRATRSFAAAGRVLLRLGQQAARVEVLGGLCGDSLRASASAWRWFA